MARVEVRIWADNAGKGIPLVIRGKNFTPLMRATSIIDDNKTEELITQYQKEMQRLIQG